MKMNDTRRCDWVNLRNPSYVEYHDREWGVPVYDDDKLFELLTLEGAQAGLSWETILRKRAGYRNAFADFDIETVSAFSADRLQELCQDAAIVRNRLKVASVVVNANCILRLREAGQSFADYLWSFVDGSPIVTRWAGLADVPASTEVSERMSRELKKRGFKFVGPTICYAFMQAAGLVDDHMKHCFRADP